MKKFGVLVAAFTLWVSTAHGEFMVLYFINQMSQNGNVQNFCDDNKSMPEGQYLQSSQDGKKYRIQEGVIIDEKSKVITKRTAAYLVEFDGEVFFSTCDGNLFRIGQEGDSIDMISGDRGGGYMFSGNQALYIVKNSQLYKYSPEDEHSVLGLDFENLNELEPLLRTQVFFAEFDDVYGNVIVYTSRDLKKFDRYSEQSDGLRLIGSEKQ